MRVHVDNFVWGRRGPMSVVLVDTGDALHFGTVFFRDAPGSDVTTASGAISYVEEHAADIIAALSEPFDWDSRDEFWAHPGLAKDPKTELLMLERAKTRAGWSDLDDS